MQVGVIHMQPAEQALAHVHVIDLGREDAAHVGIVVAVLLLGREGVGGLERRDRVDDGDIGHVPAAAQHIAPAAEEIVDPVELVFELDLDVGTHGHLVQGDALVVLRGQRRVLRPAVCGEGLREHLRLVPVVGGGRDDLVSDIGAARIVDIVRRRYILVLECLHQVPVGADRVAGLLLVEVSPALDAVGTAPLGHLADVILGKELRTVFEEGVAGRGRLRADVVPEGRIEGHGIIPVAGLEAFVESRGPHASALQHHRRLIVEGPADHGTEELRQVCVIGTETHVDVLLHGIAVQVIHETALAGARGECRIEPEKHDFPAPGGHLARERAVAEAGADIAPLPGIEVHRHGSDVLSALGQGERHFLRLAGDILLLHFDALGAVLGILAVEESLHHAARILPFVIEGGALEAQFQAFLDGSPIEFEVLFAQVGDTGFLLLAAGAGQVLVGEAGRAAAAGDQHERSPFVRLEIPFHGLPHGLFRGAVQVQGDEADAPEFPVRILETLIFDPGHVDVADHEFLLGGKGGRQQAGRREKHHYSSVHG